MAGGASNTPRAAHRLLPILLAIAISNCRCGSEISGFDYDDGGQPSTDAGPTDAGSLADQIVVSTLAGWTEGFRDGPGIPDGGAEFGIPSGIAVDALGRVFVADQTNNRIREIDPQGNVTTLAGNGVCGIRDGTGGPDGTAEFCSPAGLVFDPSGTLLVTDNNWAIAGDQGIRIRSVAPNGDVRTLSSVSWTASQLSQSFGIAMHSLAAIYLTDVRSNGVYEIDSSVGLVQVWPLPGARADSLNEPWGLALDGDGSLYLSDFYNSRVVALRPDGGFDVVAGNGRNGFADGPGGPSGSAELWYPRGIALDDAGALVVADYENSRIRRVDRLGNVTTIAGNGVEGHVDGNGGPDGAAEFTGVHGVAIDAAGSIYVTDLQNFSVRKISFVPQ